MYYWNILELESKKEMITKKMVQEKYQEVRKRLTETYSPHDKKLQDSMNLLNMAYKYCNNDMSIAIRNNIVKNSERPNAELKVEYVKEESAKILGKRKDIREIDFLKNEKIVGELKKAGMNFNQLVPPEQKEESLFFDFESGQILSSRDTETSILLEKVNNSVRDQEFQIEKVAIYNIADPKTAITDNGSNSYARAGQLTQYNLIKSNLNSITKELITLYGEIDLEVDGTIDQNNFYDFTARADGLHGNFEDLYEWATSGIDPISDYEMHRNNEIDQNYQRNRNPFIDHPEFIIMIYDKNYNGPGALM